MNKLTYSDKLKFERLVSVFESNFRITRLYASYLESFPEIITKEMIDSICSDGRIEQRDAIAALLGEIFGLDTKNRPEDRILMREYVIPSIKILDAKKYTDNPYYQNVKLPDIKDGAWEFKNESYAPYRGVICADMTISDGFSEIPPLGFFGEEFRFPAVLEDGNEWMTLTPVDMDTCEEAIEAAQGKVVTFGLGLGYYAYMASRKPNVESVTVVERSEEVIELFKRHILPHFEFPEKINIVCSDAFEYAKGRMPQEKFDVAFVDIWRDASDGAPIYKEMKSLEPLSPGTKFLYWIENFLISRLRAEKFAKITNDYDNGRLELTYGEILGELREIP